MIESAHDIQEFLDGKTPNNLLFKFFFSFGTFSRWPLESNQALCNTADFETELALVVRKMKLVLSTHALPIGTRTNLIL